MLVAAPTKLDVRARDLLIRDETEKVRDAIEPGALLIVGTDDVPGSELRVRRFQHHVARVRVIVPALPRLDVHWA